MNHLNLNNVLIDNQHGDLHQIIPVLLSSLALLKMSHLLLKHQKQVDITGISLKILTPSGFLLN